MPKVKKLLCCLVAAGMISFSPLRGDAAESGKKPEAKAPIVIEADEIYFSDLTGNMFAKGQVVIVQDKSRLTGELIRGNTKQNEVWIDDKAKFTEPGVSLTGSQIRYNYGNQSGTIAAPNGKIGRDFVVGERLDLLPGEYIIHNGTVTACPAKVPDYHVSATKVEIWPDDKLIAYNVKFWIKDKVIYSMPKYQKSLRKDAASEFPSVGYTNQDGFFIVQHLEYPIGDKVAVFTDLGYYSKRGYRPVYGAINRERDYSLGVVHGYFRDTDNRWIKKEPEFRFDFYSHRLGSLPVSYRFYAIYGKWTDAAKTSWHQDYNLYFSGDPIRLDDTLKLYLGTGVQHVRESFNGSHQNVFSYDATLYKTWSPRFTSFVGYQYTKNNQTLFEYNKNDLARQLNLGFTYQIDRLNTVSFLQTYDVKNNRVYDQDVTWYRNLHCWEAIITYRIKRSELRFDFAVARF